MFCMNCGKELPDDANFCLTCGKPQRPNRQEALPSASAHGSPVVRLACPSCGGMLPLPTGSAEFMSCTYCHTSLQIRRSAGRVILEEDPWETCEIKSRRLDGTFSFRFHAEAVGPQGMYTAAVSPAVSVDPDSFVGKQLGQSSLDWLVRVLYEEGWESVQAGMDRWYNYKFRRRVHEPKAHEWCCTDLKEVQKSTMFRSGQGRLFAQVMNGPNRGKVIVEFPSNMKVYHIGEEVYARDTEKDEPLLNTLVKTLEHDSWQLLHNGPDWWFRVFRRPLS